jgi:hypothetical protein
VSASAEKKKKEAVRWAAAGWFGGPAGLAGPKGGKISFFLFFFKLLLKQLFVFKFKPNSFKLFLKNFINFLEATQATKKNHASQLMMHKHLLSLYLLNYV